MGRELRIIGFIVSATIALAFLAHNIRPEKPIPVSFPIADETKPKLPRAVRNIQIYKSSDQLPIDTVSISV
jgi:hypothetical protein